MLIHIQKSAAFHTSRVQSYYGLSHPHLRLNRGISGMSTGLKMRERHQVLNQSRQNISDSLHRAHYNPSRCITQVRDGINGIVHPVSGSVSGHMAVETGPNFVRPPSAYTVPSATNWRQSFANRCGDIGKKSRRRQQYNIRRHTEPKPRTIYN